MSTPNPTIRFADASFSWPDGTTVLDHANLDIGPGRTGLVGDNGTGKSTVLRLIAGQLMTTTGTVVVDSEVGHLPQHLTLDITARVADLLGVSTAFDALRAIEAGQVNPELYDAVGEDWDVESRSIAALSSIGLPGIALERSVGTLSGGEAMLVALAGLRLARKPVVLLDEPTNNLDRHARELLCQAVLTWRGALVVVSHDVQLLDLMNTTVELYDTRFHSYGGGYSEFDEARRQEQVAAQQAVRSAEQYLKRERRQQCEAEGRLARRQRYATTDHANKRKPKMVMNTRRFQAQNSAGKLRENLEDRVTTARDALAQTESRVRDDEAVRITLPDPQVPAGRRLAEIHHASGTLEIVGPQRVAIVGRNGVGKTRLLETMSSETDAVPHIRLRTRRMGYLPQRMDGLLENESALDAVRSSELGVPPQEVRAQLARFHLTQDQIERRVSTLSGGERFRIALARLLLAQPPHELLVLDEPTNNLDLRTIAALVEGLQSYRGAVLVVSHDSHFLDQLGLHDTLELRNDGSLDAEE